MIHYGKTPQGDLVLRVSADEVGEVLALFTSAGLLQRRTFDGMKRYIESEFKDDLAAYQRRMTAQIPVAQEGGQRC